MRPISSDSGIPFDPNPDNDEAEQNLIKTKSEFVKNPLGK
jgi:hypothetical protein